MWFEVAIALFLLLLVFIGLFKWSRGQVAELRDQLRDLVSKKHSLSSKYGKMTEQFLPFLESYPYNEQNFRFIGTPIDGVQFENDKIVFVEFKVGDSRLTSRQREIRDLVNRGRIEFKEFRIG